MQLKRRTHALMGPLPPADLSTGSCRAHKQPPCSRRRPPTAPAGPTFKPTAGKEQLEDAGSNVLKSMLDKVEALHHKGERCDARLQLASRALLRMAHGTVYPAASRHLVM